MSQQDFLYNQVIEELLREKSNYYISQKKNRDFWILTSPDIIKDEKINNKIKNTSFYKKNKKLINLAENSKQEFYSVLVSTNLDFIDWFKLRIGDFEEIDVDIVKDNYKVDGIYLKLEPKIFDKNILNINEKLVHPNILKEQFSNFINNSYYFSV
jgi:hypothetical protein